MRWLLLEAWVGMKYILKDGLLTQDPMPTEDQLKKIYADYYTKRSEINGVKFGYPDYEKERSPETFKKYYFKWFFSKHPIELSSAIIKPEGICLDFGCGTGTLIEALRKEGITCEGLEFSEDSFSALKDRNIKFYRYEQLKNIPNETYSAVYLIDTVEHLLTPLEDLKEIHRIMKPGATLFIETINSDSLYAKHKGDKWSGRSPVHLHLFGKRSLVKMLNQVGFIIEEIATKGMTRNPLRKDIIRVKAGKSELPKMDTGFNNGYGDMKFTKNDLRYYGGISISAILLGVFFFVNINRTIGSLLLFFGLIASCWTYGATRLMV